MLKLKDIKKDYVVAGQPVPALKGISVNFRRNELVSVLGPSGCGKTTLLNIIGGLDHYTSGDLIIGGKSTKKFTDRDWDTYRNHSIGFIFQSYHLIPHQTVLQNVELALTISGVGKEERRARAIEALEKVGLGEKIHSRPNQLSGGQAQRVAIARALINDPEIVLADEPTGALDSKTSVQIMELLKEISRDRLVIMVTHNPELARQYSTRIIRLLDGLVVDDDMPYEGLDYPEEGDAKPFADAVGEKDGSEPESEPENAPEADGQSGQGDKKTNKGRKKKTSMSLPMAFGLSFKNLLSKRKRTAMVSVAGSIGIIGVSMVLAISAGVQNYIRTMENDMLSGNPVMITETAIRYDVLMDAATSSGKKVDITRLDDKIYVDSLLDTLVGMGTSLTTNDISPLYVQYLSDMPEEYYNSVQYSYRFNLSNNIYTDFTVTDGEIDPAEDSSGNVSITAIRQMYTSVLAREEEYARFAAIIPEATSFEEIPDNSKDNYSFILSQYDFVATDYGKTEGLTERELDGIFDDKSSLILVVDDGAATDLTLGQFGYFTQEEFLDFAFKALKENELDDKGHYDEDLISGWLNGKPISDFVGENSKTFTWYPNDTVYSLKDESDRFYTVSVDSDKPQTDLTRYTLTDVTDKAVYKYNPSSEGFPQEGKVDLKVKAILQKKKGVSYGCLEQGLYYTHALTRHMLETSAESGIAKYIEQNGSLAVLPYNYSYTFTENGEYHSSKTVPVIGALTTGFISGNSDMFSSLFSAMSQTDPLASYRVSADMVGGKGNLISVSIYPKDFKTKDMITDYLDKWNEWCENENPDDGFADTPLTKAETINYTDNVGLIVGMINTMIKMITIALIAFTALSLIVSTVMIGIITYVSVVERIKEIGILRAVGARKKDIKRLFNAETFMIGLSAGLVGIIVTYILSLVLNLIIGALAGIYTIAALPWWQAIIMVAVSVVLTLISGLIPAAAAAKKDPVVALRTE